MEPVRPTDPCEARMRPTTALLLSCITLIAASATAVPATAQNGSPPALVAPPKTATGTLSFSPVTLDMGEMTAGQPKTADLTITNTSDSPVTIESIKGGCGCTKVTEPPKGPIAPGGSVTVQVTMDPGLRTGIALRKPVHVTLVGGRVESMSIVATVKTVIRVDPEVVEAFGKDGKAMPTVVLSSVDAKPFQVTAAAPSGIIDLTKAQSPADRHELAVNVEAWARAGRPATILLSTDRADAPSVAVPVKSAEAVGMFRLPAAPEGDSHRASLESAQDAIIREIDAGLGAERRSPQLRIRLHRETGMLFVHGSELDLDAVRDAVRALPPASGVRESSPAPGM